MSYRGEVSLLAYQWTGVCLLHLDPVTGPIRQVDGYRTNLKQTCALETRKIQEKYTFD